MAVETFRQNSRTGEYPGWNFDSINARSISYGPTNVGDIFVAPMVRWAFYLFVAAIPFEPVGMGIPVEITSVALGLLVLSLVFQIPLVFQRPPLAFGMFALYVLIVGASLFLRESAFKDEIQWQTTVLVQLLLMSWIAFCLMRSDSVARNALLTLALSCVFLAVLQLAGITRTVSDTGSQNERVSAMGFHPNNAVRIMALGLLSLMGLAYGMRRSYIKPVYVVWIGFGLIGLAIVQMGSRGGMIALAAGLFVYVVRTGNIAAKVRNVFLVVAAIGSFAFIALQSDDTRGRFEEAVQGGDLARREQIYPMAWQMFLEKSVWGWGARTSEYELGARLAHPEEVAKNPHNLILHLLLSTGIVGAVPMLLGIGLCTWAAWKARLGSRGVVPLSMIAMVLVANMSGIWLSNKLHWFVMAFALSSLATTKRF